MFRECGKLLYKKASSEAVRDSLQVVCMASNSIWGEVWYLKENEMGMLRTERFMVRAMCAVQLKDSKKSQYLMLMLGLKGTLHWLAMANSVCGRRRIVMSWEGKYGLALKLKGGKGGWKGHGAGRMRVDA